MDVAAVGRRDDRRCDGGDDERLRDRREHAWGVIDHIVAGHHVEPLDRSEPGYLRLQGDRQR